jgi:hypothetical protein
MINASLPAEHFGGVGCSALLGDQLASVRVAIREWLHAAAPDRPGCAFGGEERDQSLRRFNLV